MSKEDGDTEDVQENDDDYSANQKALIDSLIRATDVDEIANVGESLIRHRLRRLKNKQRNNDQRLLSRRKTTHFF